MNDQYITDIPTYNNLIQNFFTIGIDTELILSNEFYKDPHKYIDLNETFKPSLLTSFPDNESTLSNIPYDIIIRHIFPNGFTLIKSETPPSNTNFFFSLPLFPSHPLYRKIYYTCLIVYEPLSSYETIKNDYYTSLTSTTHQEQEVDITAIINDKLIPTSTITFEGNYSLTNPSSFYVPKALCFSSLLPYPTELYTVLNELYNNYCVKQTYMISLDKLIEHFVLTLQIPPRGQQKMFYKLFDTEVSFSQRPINSIPNCSIDLDKIFNYYKVNDVLNIYRAVLLEIPIIFFCTDNQLLSVFVEGFTNLCYPYTYQYPVCAFLPFTQYSLIEVLKVFVFGINLKYHEKFFELNNIELSEKELLVVNVDNKEIKLIKRNVPEKDVLIIRSVNECNNNNKDDVVSVYENIDLPIHYKKKLTETLMKCNKIKDKINNNEDIDKFNFNVRYALFYFIVSIMWDYKKYIRNVSITSSNVDISEIYDRKEFINAHSGGDVEFYKRFTLTKMFKSYIIKCILPSCNEDIIEVMFFDEKIIEKKNKNIFNKALKTPFLDIKDFDKYKHQPSEQPCEFNDNEISYLSQPDIQQKAIQYFQRIKSTNKKINISYYVFPKLLYDNEFFDKPYKQIYFNNQLSMNSVNLNNDIINSIKKAFPDKFKHTLMFNKKQNNINLENYIHLTWLLLSSLTFYYIDSNVERNFRFAEMLYTLNTSLHDEIESDLIVLIFNVIVTYGNNEHMIALLNYILTHNELNDIKNNYILYALFYERTSKSFNGSENGTCTKRLSTITSRATVLMRDQVNEEESKQQFTKRTINDKEPYKTGIHFQTTTTCDKCKEVTEVYFLFLYDDNNKLNTSTKSKFTCQKCNKEIIPIMTVEINNNEREQFVVMNPQELYYEIKKQYICKRNFQLDITSFYLTQRKLFLNCVLYFSLRNLSFDILFPYIKDYCNNNNNNNNNKAHQRHFRGALSIVPSSNENISL